MPGPDQERLARILDDYLVAIERGLPVSPEELLEKYPEDAAQLRGYLSGLQLFHAVAGALPQVQGSLLGPGMPQPAETIGDYRLVREIGRGGMGVVYEAWQLSLRRRVALKILPFTVAHDAKQLSRFKNEAQAAAQVQHPNIVPVFAVGEENGVHYYVMQLIEGQSLTSLLDGLRSGGRTPHGTTAPNHPNQTLTWHKASQAGHFESNATSPQVPLNIVPMRAGDTADHIRVVARLGLQAAEALHAAHEYGVVHRDVKPSNLLLDDQGKLWVTDFGLARCREDQAEPGFGRLTQTGDILGTMRYMSPEQALGRAALIDERTDVYSLGITMYELATLHHPADEVSDIQGYFDRNRQAPKPLRHWNRHIPRDFQTIVLKCIAEFPHERYGTAHELAEDLDRFLEGRPIAASPPSLFARAGKWAKRRRGVVYAAAAVLFVGLIGAASSMMLFEHEKAAESRRALEQARTHRHEIGDVLNLFTTQYPDQLRASGAEGVRHQMLQDALDYYQKFEKEAVDDPTLATDLALAYSKSGSLSEQMGNKKQALELHKKSEAVWDERLAHDPSNVEYARNLAICQNNIGLLLASSGQPSEGLARLRQASETQARLAAADSSSTDLAADLATTHGNLGLVLSQSNDKPDAVKEYATAIEIQERLTKSPNASQAVLRSLAASYNNFGGLQDDARAKLATDVYQKAIAIQRKLVESDQINRIYQADLARTYNNLGYLSSRIKDWKKAELCYGDAIRLQEELVKASPLAGAYRRDLAISYNNLGMTQSRGGRLAEAESSFRKSAKLNATLLAAQPNDVETLSDQGNVWNNLGMLFDSQRNFADAEKAYRQAIANQRRAVDGAPKTDRYRNLLNWHYIIYARNLNRQKKYDEAVRAILTRKDLWPAKADRLYSVGQQLAATLAVMRADGASPQSQAACVHAAVGTLREAVTAGLPSQRLRDPSLASLVGNDDFRKLLDDATAGILKPKATQQTALSATN